MSESENLERHIRRAITQTEINDKAYGFFALEILLASATIGLAFHSLIIFFIASFILFSILSFRKMFIILMLLFSSMWGIIGYSICESMGFNANGGSIIFFTISLLMHFPAIDGADQYD